MSIRRIVLLAAALLSAPAVPVAAPVAAAADATAHGVTGVEVRHLDPAFWIGVHPAPDAVRMDDEAIAAQNAAMLRQEPTLHDLSALPARLSRAEVAARISALSTPPTRPLYDASGTALDAEALRRIVDNAAADAVPVEVTTRYGMVTTRADMRSFPTRQRVFSAPGDTDIDRFQETALFPGTPLALLHESRDGAWWFAISPRYAAWIEKSKLAEGPAAQVLGHAGKSPYLVVTGAKVTTVYTPEQPALSELQLDMGVRVPLLADWPPDRTVNGQHPYASRVVELPLRRADGTLAFAPALVPRSADVAGAHLPLTAANLLRQAFKFLGERYGWGHAYNGRDCSGFVSEVYRSVGIELPRNTRDQAVSEVLDRIAFAEDDSIAQRTEVLRTLDVGDLVYIPGHVMMVIGQHDGGPYVIHDVTGVGYADGSAGVRRVPLNQVAVTPLLPLRLSDGRSYVERITSIQRVRARTPSGTP